MEFNSVEIAPLEDSLRLTPWERILMNDQMVNRLFEIEVFIEQLQRGWTFIQSQHGNTR